MLFEEYLEGQEVWNLYPEERIRNLWNGRCSFGNGGHYWTKGFLYGRNGSYASRNGRFYTGNEPFYTRNVRKKKTPNIIFDLTYLSVTTLAKARLAPAKTQVKIALEGPSGQGRRKTESQLLTAIS